MTYMKVIGCSPLGAAFTKDVWLKSYKDTPDGRGDTVLTGDKKHAMKFRDAGEALDFWKQQSRYVKLRPDGKPNRPLTAYHIMLEQEDA